LVPLLHRASRSRTYLGYTLGIGGLVYRTSVEMNADTKSRLKWSRDILLSARDKLVVEKNRADRGRSVDIIQIITMVDAAALIAKEILEEIK